MPGFNAADFETYRLHRDNFAKRPVLTEMQKTEAFRAGEGVKAPRIRGSQAYFQMHC